MNLSELSLEHFLRNMLRILGKTVGSSFVMLGLCSAVDRKNLPIGIICKGFFIRMHYLLCLFVSLALVGFNML